MGKLMAYIKTKINSVKGDVIESGITKRIRSRLQRYLHTDSNHNQHPRRCSTTVQACQGILAVSTSFVEPVLGDLEVLRPCSTPGDTGIPLNLTTPVLSPSESTVLPFRAIESGITRAVGLPRASSESHRDIPDCSAPRPACEHSSKASQQRADGLHLEHVERNGGSPAGSANKATSEDSGSIQPWYLAPEEAIDDRSPAMSIQDTGDRVRICQQNPGNAQYTQHEAFRDTPLSASGTAIHRSIVHTSGILPKQEDLSAAPVHYDFDFESQSSWFEQPIGFKYARVSGKQARGLFFDEAELDILCNGLHAHRMMPLLQEDMVAVRDNYMKTRAIIERKQKQIHEDDSYGKDSDLQEEHQRLVTKKEQVQSRMRFLRCLRKQEMNDIYLEQDRACDLLVRHFLEADILIPDEELCGTWRPWHPQMPSVFSSSESLREEAVSQLSLFRVARPDDGNLQHHQQLQHKRSKDQHISRNQQDAYSPVGNPAMHSRFDEDETVGVDYHEHEYASNSGEVWQSRSELIEAIEHWIADVERTTTYATLSNQPWQPPTQYLTSLRSVQAGESASDELAVGRIRRMIDARKQEERPSPLQSAEAEHKALTKT